MSSYFCLVILTPAACFHIQFVVLYAAGTVKPKVMKLCVIGAAGAGKTTLVAALTRGRINSVFTSEKQRDDPTCQFERTMGINVMTVDIPGVGCFDYVGQEQFHKTHGFFFSAANSFIILLISLLTGEERQPCTLEELIHLAQYWLSFLRGSLEKHIIPTVAIAASRGDCCPHGQRLLQQIVCHLKRFIQREDQYLRGFIPARLQEELVSKNEETSRVPEAGEGGIYAGSQWLFCVADDVQVQYIGSIKYLVNLQLNYCPQPFHVFKHGNSSLLKVYSTRSESTTVPWTKSGWSLP